MKNVFSQMGAKPIWLGMKNRLENHYVEFKKAFRIDATGKFTLYISIDTEYELYINGNFAACNQYHDYPSSKAYDTIDVSYLLRQGENIIYILGYSQGKDSAAHISGEAMLIYALKGEKLHVVSDHNTLCRKFSAYRSGEIEKFSPQLSYSFYYDARNEHCDGQWENSTIVQMEKIKFYPRPVKKLEISDRISSEVIAQGYFQRLNNDKNKTTAQRMQDDYLSSKRPNEVFETASYEPLTFEEKLILKTQIESYGIYFVLDLKRETAGFFDMEIEASEGTVLEISYGEHLDDLRVRSYVGGRNFAFQYICREGRQKFTHRMKRIAGRYIQVHVSKAMLPLGIYYIGMLPTLYPIEFISNFKCSDRLLNKIYDVSVNTLRLCMHEHYEDCPWREQALYAMDSRIQMLCGYYAFGEFALPRASLWLLAESQNEEGWIALTAPGKCHVYLPSFTLMWVIALRDYVLYSGDMESLNEFLPYAKLIMKLFWGMQKNGLIETPCGKNCWNFYEWENGMDNYPWGDVSPGRYDAPLNLFVVLATQAYTELLIWIKMDIDAEVYKEKLKGLKTNIHKSFWNEDKKVYKTYINAKEHYSELSQALAVCAGVAEGETAENIRKELSRENNMVKTSLSCLIFKYEALLQDASYANIVFDDIEKRWGRMIYNGATSFWETDKGGYDFENAGSLCHGWSAIPVFIFYRYLLGVAPKTPFVKDILIVPVNGVVYEAEGKFLSRDKTINIKKIGNEINVF